MQIWPAWRTITNHSIQDTCVSPLLELEGQNRHLWQELKKATEAISIWQQKATDCEQERDLLRSHTLALQKEVTAVTYRCNIPGLTDLLQLNTVRNQEEVLTKDYNDMKALLEARRRELQDAQRFMGSTDAVAESEIVQQVRDLNTEIFNLAQSLSEGKPRTRDQHAQRKATEKLEDALGDRFLEMLRSIDLHGDTVLLEIAMQAVASEFLSWVISAWTNDWELDAVFESVYKRIRRSGKSVRHPCRLSDDKIPCRESKRSGSMACTHSKVRGRQVP